MPPSKSAFADGASLATRLWSADPEFDELAYRSLTPLSVGLAIIFSVFVALGIIDDSAGEARVPIVATDAASAVFYIGLHAALSAGAVRRSMTYPLGLVIAGIPLANALLAFRLTGNPFFLSYLPMIAVGCGAFMLSLPWLLGTLVIMLVSAWIVATDVLPFVTAARYLPALAGAFLIAIMVTIVRRLHVIDSHRAVLAARIEIEERKRVEGHLAHVQRLESIGKLASGIAHDFNNLLMVIIGYTDNLLDTTDRNSSLHEDLLEVRRAGEKAAALASKLLAFSRQQVMQPRVLDINELVGSTESLISRSLPANVTLRLELDPAAGRVRTDPLQMEQVLINLVLNARDAMADGGGVLTIATAAVAESVELRVTDTGCGMPPEVRERVFEPFFTTKEPGGGTGLGLAMVYGIVTQSGGSIDIETAPGAGTSIGIRLARVDAPLQETGVEATVNDEREPLRHARVLVVDDDEGVRDIVIKTLEKKQCSVISAASGEEALALAEREPFDIVLSDVVMPGMSGVDLVKALQERGHLQPAVLMSGHAAGKVVEAGGSTAPLLQKPFRARELLQSITRALAEGTKQQT